MAWCSYNISWATVNRIMLSFVITRHNELKLKDTDLHHGPLYGDLSLHRRGPGYTDGEQFSWGMQQCLCLVLESSTTSVVHWAHVELCFWGQHQQVLRLPVQVLLQYEHAVLFYVVCWRVGYGQHWWSGHVSGVHHHKLLERPLLTAFFPLSNCPSGNDSYFEGQVEGLASSDAFQAMEASLFLRRLSIQHSIQKDVCCDFVCCGHLQHVEIDNDIHCHKWTV